MKRAATFSPEIERMLAAEREIPAAPAELQARVLQRVRAALLESPQSPSPMFAQPRRAWVGAAALAAAVAAVSFAGLRAFAPSDAVPVRSPADDPPPLASNTTPEAKTPDAQRPAERAPTPSGSSTASAQPRRVASTDGHTLELAILQRARAAVASGRFPAALESITEHQRRFPNGLLQEEREALRVKALAGLGKTDEAQAAARRFGEKFPHSVLTPRLDAGTQKAP